MEEWREPSKDAENYERIVILWRAIKEDEEKGQYMGIFAFNGINNQWISVHGDLSLSLKDTISWYPLPELNKENHCCHNKNRNPIALFSSKRIGDSLYVFTWSKTGDKAYFCVNYCPFCGEKG